MYSGSKFAHTNTGVNMSGRATDMDRKPNRPLRHLSEGFMLDGFENWNVDGKKINIVSYLKILFGGFLRIFF